MPTVTRSNGRFFTNLIDFNSEAVVNFGPFAFNATLTAYGGSIQQRAISRNGRSNTAQAPTFRMGDPRGGGTAVGMLVPGQQPLPVGIKWANGTATYQLQDGCKLEMPVRASGFAWNHTEAGKGADENFHATFNWILNGDITVTWNGTPVTFSAPSATDRETWVGMSKTYDQRGLLTGATQRIDIEGIANTDAAEVTKIVALIAAASIPITNLKVKYVTFQKADDDSTGGTAIITYALQDSRDDVETPRNNYTTDDNKILDQTMQAAVFVVAGGTPVAPAAPDGLKLRPPTIQKLNDQRSFILWTWRRTDSADDILNPQTKTDTDPEDLRSTATRAVLYDPDDGPPVDPTPVSGLQIVSVNDTKINDNVTDRVYVEGKNTSKDEVEQNASSTFVDPTGITSRAKVALVDATPSTPAGLVSRGLETRQLTADGHVVNVLEAGTRSTAQDITMPHTNSKRSIIGPWEDQIAAIVNSVTTDAAEADTLWAAVQGNDYSLGLSVTSVDPLRKLVIYSYVNPGVIVDFAGGGGQRTIYAKVDADGDVNIFVSSNWAETGGYRRMTFSPRIVKVASRDLIYRRFGKGTTVPDHPTQFGDVNSSTFDGLGTGKVQYTTAKGTTRRDSSARAFFLDFYVHYDSLGIINQIPMEIFQGERRIASSCTTQYGWVKASAVSSDIAAAFNLPTASDLSFIYTVPLV